jgi:hypothetical protein
MRSAESRQTMPAGMAEATMAMVSSSFGSAAASRSKAGSDLLDRAFRDKPL